MVRGIGTRIVWCVTTILFLLPTAFSAGIVSKSVSIPSVCLNGAYNKAGICVCNPGFSEYKGNCFLTTSPTSCPTGSVLWNGVCQLQSLPPIQDIVPAKETYIVVPPLRVTMPTPDPLDPNNVEEDDAEDDADDEGAVSIVPTRDQHLTVSHRQIVNNHNVIRNETTLNTHTVNNVIVQIMRRKANGALRTVVIRNNETTVHEEGPNEKPPSKTEMPSNDEKNCSEEPTTTVAPNVDPPCCTIVSPRVCRKQEDEWVCFHRKQYVCNNACTAPVMYLRPRKPQFHHPWLIMPPMPNYAALFPPCRVGQCSRPDCSGCLRGRGRCHPMCHTYDCMKDDSCYFVDQELICKGKPGHSCALLEDKTIQLLEPPQANRTMRLK